MDNKGWIKLHRKALDNPVVCRDAEHLAVWIYLLLEATHCDYDKIFEGKRVTLKPGELICGRKIISDKLRISESKVQRILKRFETEQQIEQRTSSANRWISILNWNEYQESEQQIEQQLNNQRTTTEQQLNTLQEQENIRSIIDTNVSTSNEQAHTTSHDGIDYKKLIEFFNKKTNGVFGNVRYPVSESRKGMIRARIREHGKEAFAEMIEKSMNSNFLKGDNKSGWKAKFDWMIRPTNFQKIIEGNYNNSQTHNDSLLTYEQVVVMANKGEATFDQFTKIQTEGGKVYYKRK